MMWIESESMVEPMFSITPTTKVKVACADLMWNPNIAGIKFRRPLVFSKRASPFTAAAVNGRPELPADRVTRLEFDGPIECSQRGIIVTTDPVMKYTQRQMCLRRLRSNRQCAFDVRLYLLQLYRSQAI